LPAHHLSMSAQPSLQLKLPAHHPSMSAQPSLQLTLPSHPCRQLMRATSRQDQTLVCCDAATASVNAKSRQKHNAAAAAFKNFVCSNRTYPKQDQEGLIRNIH